MKYINYVRDYLAIKEALSQQGEEVLTRLIVRAVALEQLPDLATQGIVTPVIRTHWLARNLDLIERITSLNRRATCKVRKNE